jgi:hypothetical protein
MIRFGLLEGRLPVLADHDKGGEEDRPSETIRVSIGHGVDSMNSIVKVDKRHRPRERGDLISDPQLKVRGPLCLMCHDDGVPLATCGGMVCKSSPNSIT